MHMPYTKVLIHAVWGTKNKYPYLNGVVLPQMIDHIKSNAKKKSIKIDRINGHRDHIHCLLKLNKDITLSKTIQLIKGESSCWANKIRLTPEKFEWADEYYAISISQSQLTEVRRYIDTQEEHHRKFSFEEEYEKWIESLQKG